MCYADTIGPCIRSVRPSAHQTGCVPSGSLSVNMRLGQRCFIEISILNLPPGDLSFSFFVFLDFFFVRFLLLLSLLGRKMQFLSPSRMVGKALSTLLFRLNMYLWIFKHYFKIILQLSEPTLS